jgi:pyruvate kinase
VKRRTKIIATMGPAVASPQKVGMLVAAGMDVARLNFSHGDRDSHRQFLQWVREAAAEQGRAVAVMQDIQGPRIRTGTFPGGRVDLTAGDQIALLDGDGVGSAKRVYVQHLEAAHLSPGDTVIFDDGFIEARVIAVTPGSILVEVQRGGSLGDHKGVAFPKVRLDLPAVTAKDLEDLRFGLEIGVDLVAASFVESAADVEAVRSVVGSAPVIAKIERAAALGNLAGILAAADGAMVARGDLGVEIGYEPLPRIQREIIAAANSAGRVSITPTEMLESMITALRPTRAEVSDVATAVMDGSDAVMLSGETAVGLNPVLAVEAMSAICREAERGGGDSAPTASAGGQGSFASAIAGAVAEASAALGLRTVVAFTETGTTARLISKCRPRAEVVAFTPRPETYRRMALLWGVTPMDFPRCGSTDEMIAIAEEILVQQGLVSAGDRLAMAAGVPPNRVASTNLLKLHVVGEGVAGAGAMG